MGSLVFEGIRWQKNLSFHILFLKPRFMRFPWSYLTLIFEVYLVWNSDIGIIVFHGVHLFGSAKYALRMERSPGPWSPLESFIPVFLLFDSCFCSLKATFRAVQGMWTEEFVRHLFPGTQQKHSLTAQLVLNQQTETLKALAPRLHSGTTFPEKLSGTTSTDNRPT